MNATKFGWFETIFKKFPVSARILCEPGSQVTSKYPVALLHVLREDPQDLIGI